MFEVAQSMGGEARHEHHEPEEVSEERRLERMDRLRDMTYPDVHRPEEHAREHHEADAPERARRRPFAACPVAGTHVRNDAANGTARLTVRERPVATPKVGPACAALTGKRAIKRRA